MIYLRNQERRFLFPLLAVVQHLLALGKEIDTKRRSAFNNKNAAVRHRLRR